MRKGFTLVELMIVIAIIAIIAAIAIPSLLESRVTSNEQAAAASMKTFHGAQVGFQSGGYNDGDGDNLGEYGYLDHLTGTSACFGKWGDTDGAGLWGQLGAPLAAGTLDFLGSAWDPPIANRAAGFVWALGVPQFVNDSMSGYRIGLFLSADDTSDYSVDPTGVPAIQARLGDAERHFGMVAVPETWGDTGRRFYCMTQRGEILTTAPSQTVAGVDVSVNDNNLLAGAASAITTIQAVVNECFGTTPTAFDGEAQPAVQVPALDTLNVMATRLNRTTQWEPATR